MKLRIISVAIIGILIYSCSPKITPQVTEASNVKGDPEEPAISTASLPVSLAANSPDGKSIYENNCAKCHKLYDPKSFSRQAWIPILYDMQKKAQLSDAEMDKILAYLSKE
ncbi:cytochrome c [Flavobacterium sp.]|uniref:c-type cytochrome n=1 Tax=Flavobacterium sp. TaxID=239 RepID=UPI00333F45B5